MFSSEKRGTSTKKRQQEDDENKKEEMTMITLKRRATLVPLSTHAHRRDLGATALSQPSL
jgi:hypothetical protein